MTERILQVQHAEVNTAAVEVKTLTIRGKQVTLAVFRQLMRKDLVNSDGTLAGVPWGIVNYHPDKCADGHPHVHVVWQEGAELRRAFVRTDEWWAGRFESDAADAYCTMHYIRYKLGIAHDFWNKRFAATVHASSYNWPVYSLEKYPGVTMDFHLSPDVDGLHAPDGRLYDYHARQLEELMGMDPEVYESERQAEQLARGDGGSWHYVRQPLDERIDAARKECEKLRGKIHEAARVLHEHPLGPARVAAAEVEEAVRLAVAAEHERRERLRSVTASLLTLPQLFIAV